MFRRLFGAWPALWVCLCFLLGLCALPASGQLVGGESEREVVITLDSGETLKGPLVGQSAEAFTLNHLILGELRIPIIRVASIYYVRAGESPDSVFGPQPIKPPGDPVPVVIEQPAPPKPPEPKPEPAPKPQPKWSGSVELGLNGSEGNTQLQRGRVAFDAKRVAPGSTFDLRVRYQAAQTRSVTTENRLTLRARNEWATSSADWRVFLEGGAERDQFRDFDWRVTGNAGFAYDAIKSDPTKLTLRAGIGGSTEFGSPRDGIFPESVAGYEFHHKLNKQMTLTSLGEINLDLDNLWEYRARVNAALDTSLTDNGAWRLRVGIEDRYETNTTRAKRNDIDYFISLVYRF
ncbi:MAG: DUF481 domain-containing protein [Phycisphaeraceae bacterium]|nr:DUF481 domain-containing protein [Phycisphaeraceae bacterium]